MKAKNQKQMKINRRMRFETHLQQELVPVKAYKGKRKQEKNAISYFLCLLPKIKQLESIKGRSVATLTNVELR